MAIARFTRHASTACEAVDAGRAVLALALASLAAVLAAAPAAAAEAVEPATEPRPALLLIHGGGFFEGSPAAMDYAAGIAAAQGTFATLQPAYPLDNLPGAFNRLKGIALALRAGGREVYAYGDSAGGAIAVWLASRGFVRAAGAKAPPTALVGWRSPVAVRYATAPRSDPRSWRHLHATPRARRIYSSAYRPSLRPVRIFHSCADTVVPCSINTGFARREPNVSLTRIWGPHKHAPAKAFSFERSLEWLAELHERSGAADRAAG